MTTHAPLDSAKAAGLHYVTDARPGIRRRKRGGSFSYVDRDGKPIVDAAELARIRRLAIPPAYSDVWICPDPRGHLQATGRDARGRKQYRYHPRWREVRDETKFDRMIAFAKALPAIRRAVARDLALPDLPRDKVLATVVELLASTSIRIGNDEYAKANDSFGLTTLQGDHVRISGDRIRFTFRGKGGREHAISVRDRRLARIVRRMRDLPGQELFAYVDTDAQPHTVSSHDVNAYLRAISGDDFTAKDFRTWEGTLVCALALAGGTNETTTKTEARARIAAAIDAAAARLGNTAAVCRKAYIHPGIIDEFTAKGLLDLGRAPRHGSSDPHALGSDELRILAFIERLSARDEDAHLQTLLRASVSRAKRSAGRSRTG